MRTATRTRRNRKFLDSESVSMFCRISDYGSRYASNGDLQTGRNSQRVDSMLSQSSEKSDYQTIPKGDCAFCHEPIVGEVCYASTLENSLLCLGNHRTWRNVSLAKVTLLGKHH